MRTFLRGSGAGACLTVAVLAFEAGIYIGAAWSLIMCGGLLWDALTGKE